MTARGNEHRDIYRDEADRLKFLELVAAQSKLFRLRPRCYVLMDNHFHLGLETIEPKLSRVMEWQCELERLVQSTAPPGRTSARCAAAPATRSATAPAAGAVRPHRSRSAAGTGTRTSA